MEYAQKGSARTLDAQAILAHAGLARGMRVADLGCGTTGHVIIPAARVVGEEGAAYAVDVLPSALAATESRAKLARATNITYVWSDLARLGATDIRAGSLDVALLVSTLHIAHANVPVVLAEAARLVRPGGTLVVVEWKHASPLGPSPDARIGRDAVLVAARAAGFALREEFDASAYHYGMVFTKE